MERELLYQKIYGDLLLGIQEGTYPPGSRLPSEKELTEQYGVSRITSKKALEMLADQNLITRMPGKGSYVLERNDIGEEIRNIAKEVQEAVPVTTKKLVGVIVDSFASSYGCRVIYGIEHECRRNNFNMVLKCSYGSLEEEAKALDDLVEMKADGIILMCAQDENYNAKVIKLFAEEFPIVLVDREMPGLAIPCVNTDNYSATKELMGAMIDSGHKNIGFLSHQYKPLSTVALRFSGYLDSILEHGLAVNENFWIRDLDTKLPRMSDDDGDEFAEVERLKKIIQEYPQITGFFAVNQPLGVMTYKVLKEMGLEKEKEVFFFDNIEENIDSNPIFTHIEQGEFMIGVVAVQHLRDLMKGKEVPLKNYIPYQLVKKSPVK